MKVWPVNQFFWSRNKKADFVNSICIDTVNNTETFLDELLNATSNIIQENVDKAVDMIGNVFLGSAERCNMLKKTMH